jgi:hypothetical protein
VNTESTVDTESKREQIFMAIADIPWGVLAFALVVLLVVTHEVKGEDLGRLATAAGLLGVGHGIHTASRNIRRRP